MKMIFNFILACTGPDPIVTVVAEDGVDLPLAGLSEDDIATFFDGDRLFDFTFAEGDGLGPVYIRSSCGSCHAEGGRGPGTVQKMVVVESDGVTPAADQSVLAWGHTVRPYVGGSGPAQAIVAPTEGWPDGNALLVTVRYPPPVLARGYLEAIEDAEIERVEAEQADRTDGISGRINRVTYRSQANEDDAFHGYTFGETDLIGRFGLKARQPTLDDFAGDALQGDMGITSPLRPDELPNPAGLPDDDHVGLDADLKLVNDLADYMRLIAIPQRAPEDANGRELFEAVGCGVCHVPALRTRADYPIAQLADLDAPVFTDLLLHDLGVAMGDGMTDESATPTEWKTAPLVGLRFMGNLLHDGRAVTVEDAILDHAGDGSEANGVIDAFDDLSLADRASLIAFVESL